MIDKNAPSSKEDLNTTSLWLVDHMRRVVREELDRDTMSRIADELQEVLNWTSRPYDNDDQMMTLAKARNAFKIYIDGLRDICND